ncbi:Innexin inx1, partial [Orchesella cincta]
DLQSYFKRQEVIIDCPIFRVHTIFTTVLLAVCSLITSWTQFVKEPIQCSGGEAVDKKMDLVSTPGQVAHPGVTNDFGDDTPRKTTIYYQWVCFVLFFQALFCYFPKWLWESWERKRMFTIICGLNTELHKKDDLHKKGLLDSQCEVLCFINIVFQMFLMNWFFSGDFMKYGIQVLAFDEEEQANRDDHMIYVFPRITKCIFRKFGPSGSVEKHDALCLLPMNLINEKTYILIWFWFVVLVVLTWIVVVFRVCIFLSPALRFQLIHTRNKTVSDVVALDLYRRLSVGDWWLLYMLAQNIDPKIYKEVIKNGRKKCRIVGNELCIISLYWRNNFDICFQSKDFLSKCRLCFGLVGNPTVDKIKKKDC